MGISGVVYAGFLLRSAGRRRVVAFLQPIAVIAGLDDVAAMGDPIEQRRGHLGVAMCGSTELSGLNSMLTWPPIRSVTAGALPLYGTWISFVPVIDLNSSADRCCGVPLPPDA